jgi:SAM-dependent methyltransferase
VNGAREQQGADPIARSVRSSRPGDRGPEVAAVEQRLVFGEVAAQYDEARPSYPDALFDTVIEHGRLAPGDAALEIGAGTGKATRGFVARGLAVHALEPSPGMAAVLRANGIDAEETTFEDWPAQPDTFRLVFAAQAWHWVQSVDRYEKAARVLAPGGTLALFWNLGREWDGELGAANDAAYKEHAPHLMGGGAHWQLDKHLDELAAVGAFDGIVKREITWEQRYSSAEWTTLLGTHSDHRMLPEEQRVRLHHAVGNAIDRHGGFVDVVYDVQLYLATRV